MKESDADREIFDLDQAAADARKFFNSLRTTDNPTEPNPSVEDPTLGRETQEIRGKRHWRGCIEKVWIRIGINDPWTNGTLFPYSFLFEEHSIELNEGMRITAYQNFPDRDTEKALADYDLIVIHTPHGPRAHPYNTHERLLQDNAAAQEKIDADQV